MLTECEQAISLSGFASSLPEEEKMPLNDFGHFSEPQGSSGIKWGHLPTSKGYRKDAIKLNDLISI